MYAMLPIDGQAVLTEMPTPEPGPGKVRIKVAAAGVNRADLLQVKGLYPPPPGESEVLGLECAGVIDAIGEGVTRHAIGHRVCALVPGGAMGDYCIADEGTTMTIPAHMSMTDAAAIVETWGTVWDNVALRAGLGEGQWLLVHGGTSGIGSTAIQAAHLLGAKVITTGSSPEKVAIAKELGADVAIDYRAVLAQDPDHGLAKAVLDATDGAGVDVILDHIGAAYYPQHIEALKVGGRLILIGFLGGHKVSTSLVPLLTKRLSVIGSSLRNRSLDERASLCYFLEQDVWPAFKRGEIKAVVHEVLPLAEIARAHEILRDGNHVGKVILTVDPTIV